MLSATEKTGSLTLAKDLIFHKVNDFHMRCEYHAVAEHYKSRGSSCVVLNRETGAAWHKLVRVNISYRSRGLQCLCERVMEDERQACLCRCLDCGIVHNYVGTFLTLVFSSHKEGFFSVFFSLTYRVNLL